MNLDQTKSSVSEVQNQAQNTTLIGVIFALIFGALSGYVIVSGQFQQIKFVLPIFVTSLLVVWLARNRRHTLGVALLILVIAIQGIASAFLESGIGISSALTAAGLIGIISLATLSRRMTSRILILGLVVASAIVLIDLFSPATRVAAEALTVRWVISIIAFAAFLLYLMTEYSTLDIRTKITLGILATGGIALGILAVFTLDRSARLITFLSSRLEVSVKLLAEEQLTNTANSQAETIDQFFKDIEAEVNGLADYRTSLESQQQKISLGNYWDATLQVTQLSTGQYGNSATDPSSVFIPINTNVTEATISELNTSAYLDFVAPKILEDKPEILSIYNINPLGVTRYYPNINLASILPPDFDATSRPYYQITSPAFNPKHLTKWAIPYVDATGGGLVVTVASPVYVGNEFLGIIAADIQLSKVAEQASAIKIGGTGYAMIIDSDGHIIYMPPAGYAMYGIDQKSLVPEEYFKQTVLVSDGNGDLKALTRRMVAGASGLNTITVNGVETYISYTQIKSSGYILALVVPTAEMQQAIISTNSDIQKQVQSAIQLGAVIFIGLLFFAIIISILVSQIIASPILRLTLAANRIIDGYLSTQANVTTQDEIGTLAQAFNTMTFRLRENLTNLEKRVEDRTSEITIANEKIERRAKQFASISSISRIINQTRNLPDLLPEIVQTISDQFNFYHTGIFLLDANQEYAILRAASSDGGQKMLNRNHKLLVGQTGIVGYVSGSGKPRIALDTGADSIYFNNPDLPNTRSEMALPLLKTGGDIIGVLDVQSTVPNAFSQEDIEVLSALADQVAVAITNSLLYEETQKALIEGDLIYRQNLKVDWEKYSRSSNLVGIQRKGLQSSLLTEPVEISGAEIGQEDPAQPASHINIPIKLRGEKIGILSVENNNDRHFTQDELDVIAAILERAALSMENARLLEESQRRATREQTISEMSIKISSATEIEAILQTAVRELGAQISGTQISVEIGSENE